MTQEAKTFIVTFPKAFHAGFSYGVRNRSSIMNYNHHLKLCYTGEYISLTYNLSDYLLYLCIV